MREQPHQTKEKGSKISKKKRGKGGEVEPKVIRTHTAKTIVSYTKRKKKMKPVEAIQRFGLPHHRPRNQIKKKKDRRSLSLFWFASLRYSMSSCAHPALCMHLDR